MAHLVLDHYGIAHLVRAASPLCNPDRIIPREDDPLPIEIELAPHRMCLACVGQV